MMKKVQDNDTITVIIPVYNAKEYFRRAIESVQNQTYKNLDILVIDDGSNDGTGSLADEYAVKDNRVRVLHVSNGGEARSRNLALNNVRGRYVAFCDADDYMHPEMLEKMFKALVDNGTDAAVCSWKNVDAAGKELDWISPNLKSGILSSAEVQNAFLCSGNIEGFCWNKLFKKELYEKVGIQYDIRRISYCDILANYKLLSSAGKIAYVGEKLYDYYQIRTSCTNTPNIKKDEDYFDTLNEVYCEAVEYGYKKQAVVYTSYRMSKHLFEMYKNKEYYDEIFLEDYTIRAYEKFLRIPYATKVYYTIKYPLDRRMKFLIKEWMVTKYYNEQKRKTRGRNKLKY